MIARPRDVRFALLRVAVAIATILAVWFVSDPGEAVLPVAAVFLACLATYRFDLTNIFVVFSIPWLMILGFSALDISDYSRPVSRETIAAIVAVLGIGLVLLPTTGVARPRPTAAPPRVDDRVFKMLLAGYLAFCVLNVALAGFVPLLQAFTQGDSGYMDFGVKGVYGLFNAFANAFGLTAFYLWMQHRERTLYKASFFLVLGVFLLFVTRQNMMSLLVESFLVYCVVVRRVSGLRIVALVLVTLFAFAAIGDFRVGLDISDLAAINERYLWVPHGFIWLFAYCYFNILNLDNVVAATAHPAFDGSSLAALLPSFLRPEVDDGSDLLEVSKFTVDSFISPLYHDVGFFGLCAIFALLCLSVRWYTGCRRRGDFYVGDTGYAVLYFCFLFSFFVNFWFYLPVITQLAFLPMFKRLLFGRAARPGPARPPPQPRALGVSVCLATYNGARFLREQIDSVIAQLGPGDEFVVSDDGSTDDTPAILASYGDRLRVVGTSRAGGVVKNFERVLSACRGDVVVLCDQDDVWLDGRVALIRERMRHVTLLTTNGIVVDAQRVPSGMAVFDVAGVPGGFWRTLVSNRHVGACMAFRREVLDVALPFPPNIAWHDWYIALIAELLFTTENAPAPTILFRRHASNASMTGLRSTNSLARKLAMRAWMAAALAIAVLRFAGLAPRRRAT